MKLVNVALLLVIIAPSLQASGWHDYTLRIGDGYTVFRANSMDICISTERGYGILCPREDENVGPVTAYQMLGIYSRKECWK